MKNAFGKFCVHLSFTNLINRNDFHFPANQEEKAFSPKSFEADD